MSTGSVSTPKALVPWVWIGAAVFATAFLVCPCGIGVGWLLGGARGPAAPTVSEKGSQTKQDKDAIQGEWAAQGEWADRGLSVTFASDKFIPWDRREVVSREVAVFTLDSAKSPKQIDFKGLQDQKSLQAIYELNGDELKLCIAEPGKARPTSFAGNVMVFKRKQP